MLHGPATGISAMLGPGLFPNIAQASDKPVIRTAGNPKRVIFSFAKRRL
jgi:hypothetical protein